MPCYDGRYDLKSGISMGSMASLWTHNSPVSELLCEAVKKLRESNLFDSCSYELKNWAHEHDRRDRLRAYRKQRAAEKAGRSKD